MSRHALITGAGTGIGAAIATQLHGEGHNVSLIGRRLEPLAALAETLGSACVAITGDVTDRESVETSLCSGHRQLRPRRDLD